MSVGLELKEIETLFTDNEGVFKFSRWNRPIVPIVFGVDDETLVHLKTAIVTTVGVTGNKIEETDPELGANFMWFFCQDWDEILSIPDLKKLIPNIRDIVGKLESSSSKSYRIFAFDSMGGIKMCVQLIKVVEETAEMSIQALATGETFQCLLLFSRNAFIDESPIAQISKNNLCVPKPKYAALVRAAYDQVLPVATQEKSHSLRLLARSNLLIAGINE